MSRRLLAGSFAHAEELLAAVRAVRQRGLHIVDTYTPYPVHGLDQAMGLAPSRLGWVAFLAGALGAGLALWLQFWTSSVDWPINVGGRPWNSLPAFVPVIFECMVLFAGFGVVFAFLFRCKLSPGRKAVLPMPGAVDHRFVLVLEETDAVFDSVAVSRLLLAAHAVEVREWEEGEVAR